MTFFDQDLILESSIALLRPLQPSDIAYLLPFALQEPQLWTYSMVSAAGELGMQNYIQKAIDARLAQSAYTFIVYDKRQQRYAGSTRYYDIMLHEKTMEIGYTWYGLDFQGTGLNKHCKYLLLQYAFDVLQMERVAFRADETNKRSIAAMQHIGCTIEGILRNDRPRTDGSRRSSIMLSILKHEWYDNIESMLKSKLL